jgi:hypothetical protein
MIRRDYLLRMIEECIRALTRIAVFKREQRWDQASTVLDEELQKLVGTDAKAMEQLAASDLLARLMQDGPTHALSEKTLVLAALLTEAGDVAAGQGRFGQSRACHLKALQLLLETLAKGELFECPEFVPKVELLRERLQDEPLPLGMRAMLMQHHERAGEFAKAEDELFGMLDAEPENEAIKNFGLTFYQRLQARSDTELAAGNLPRAEVEEGLSEWQGRVGCQAN